MNIINVIVYVLNFVTDLSEFCHRFVLILVLFKTLDYMEITAVSSSAYFKSKVTAS